MLNNREKRSLLITSIVSLALGLVVVIPFTLGKFTKAELIIKFIAIPVILVGLTVVNYLIKYRNYRPAYRFPVLCSYTPIFTYIVAIAVNTALLLARSNQVYSLLVWIAIMVFIVLYIVAAIALIHVFFKALMVFSKNEIMIIDTLLAIIMVIDAIAFGVIASKLIGINEAFSNPSWLFIVLPLILGGLAVTFHIMYLLQMYKTDAEYKLESKAELIARYKGIHKQYYEKARIEILESLYYFSAQNIDADVKGIDDLEYKKRISILEKEISRLNNELAQLKENPQPENVFVVNETNKQLEELQAKVAKLEAEKEAAHRAREEAERAADEAERAADEAAKAADEAAKEAAEKIAREEAEKAVQEAESAKAEAEKASEEAENAKAEAEKASEEAENAKAEAEALKIAEAARIANEKAIADAKAEAAAERALALAKMKKSIKPSYDKLVKYAATLEKEEDITVLTNDKENQHKFYYQKKLFLVMNDSNVDYRIAFLKFKEQAIDLIIEYPGTVLKAKSPKGENWYRLINKGEMEEKFLKQTIKESLDVLKKIELAKKAEKERAKAEKEANRKAVKLNKKALERLSEKQDA